MNPARMRQRGLGVRSATAAVLCGYRLVFDKVGQEGPGVGHANILRCPDSVVEGVLYELSSAAEIQKMDPFERAPINYGRDAVQLQVAGRTYWAWTYFANRARRSRGLRPTQTYLSHLLAGSKFLSVDYYRALQATPVLTE